MPGVHPAANYWLDGDDGLNPALDPLRSDRHRAWRAYHPAIYTAVEYIPCSASYPPFPPFQRYSSVRRLRQCYILCVRQYPKPGWPPPRNFTSAFSPSEPRPCSHCAAGPASRRYQSRPGPANCGSDTYASFEPQHQEPSAIPMCCSLHVNCFLASVMLVCTKLS